MPTTATDEQEQSQTPPKKWQCGDPFQYPIKTQGDHWQQLLEPLFEKDRIQCEAWKDEVQNLLIFAGLFSGVLTGFIIESYSGLQPDQNEIMINLLAHIATRLDNLNPLNSTSGSLLAPNPLSTALNAGPPSPSAIRVNVFWFISLVLSLTTALVSIVSLQWLREHQQYPSSLSSKEKFAMLNMRVEGLEAWHVPEIFSSLPVLLQLALALFFVGLIDFLVTSSLEVAIPVTVIIGIPFLFLFFTTIIPGLQVFVFWSPITDRTSDVPSQAPYKSTQSRLFRRLLGCSKPIFRLLARITYALFLMSIFFSSLPRRFGRKEEAPDQNRRYMSHYSLEFIADESLRLLRLSSWLSFDKRWLAVRNAYAKSIFDRSTRVLETGYISENSVMLYDLVNGIKKDIREYASSSSAVLPWAYSSVQDLTASIFGDKEPDDIWQTKDNSFLQCLLADDGSLSNPTATFSSLLHDPPADFVKEENCFILLSQHLKPPVPILQHCAELHIRLLNHLYPGNVSAATWTPFPHFPSYSDSLMLFSYGKSPINKDRSTFSEGAISQQFSSLIRAYLEVMTDHHIEDNTLLSTPYGYQTGEIIRFAAIRQSPETLASTLGLLARSMKHALENCGAQSRRPDILFCLSSWYARTMLISDPWTYDFWPGTPYDDNADVVAFLPILRQYLETRGKQDATILARYAIPDPSDKWWNFLNDKIYHNVKAEDGEVPPSEKQITGIQTIDPLLSCEIIPSIATEKIDQDGTFILSSDASNLV